MKIIQTVVYEDHDVLLATYYKQAENLNDGFLLRVHCDPRDKMYFLVTSTDSSNKLLAKGESFSEIMDEFTSQVFIIAGLGAYQK